MVPSRNAKAQGFAEIIYLDAVHHTYIEEVGACEFLLCQGWSTPHPRTLRNDSPWHHSTIHPRIGIGPRV